MDEDDEMVPLDETAVQDASEEEEIVAPVQYDISSYGADYDVEGLVKRLNRGDILNPPFQRNYVWSLREASQFIESLLLGLPVPAVFFARQPGTNKLLVIDGQQRLKTLQFFYAGYFNPKPEDNRKQVFRLTDVQRKFLGKTYAELEEQDRVKLNDSLIHAIIVKQESPKDNDTSIYHIFDRLNSKGRRLTAQEIRTAIAHGTFIDRLKLLNDYPNWRQIFGRKSSRLKDQELITRFLAFYFDAADYERPMSEFLTKFCLKKQDADEEFLQTAEKLFKDTIDIVFNSIGPKAFRPVASINAAVFDSMMIGIAHRNAARPITDFEKVKKAYFDLLTEPEFMSLYNQATADKQNVESRLQMGIKAFSEV